MRLAWLIVESPRFDRLLLLARGGRTVYFGDIGPDSSTMIEYFEKNGGAPCPKDKNPAEMVCPGSARASLLQKLSGSIKTDARMDWCGRPAMRNKSWLSILTLLGAAPGSHTEIDWPEVRFVNLRKEPTLTIAFRLGTLHPNVKLFMKSSTVLRRKRIPTLKLVTTRANIANMLLAFRHNSKQLPFEPSSRHGGRLPTFTPRLLCRSSRSVKSRYLAALLYPI